MKIYQLSDYDYYAAHSFEEAVEVMIADTGCTRDEVIDPDASGDPVSDDLEVWANEEMTEKTTAGAIAASMTKPGWAFGCE